jgi:hypothetical protein
LFRLVSSFREEGRAWIFGLVSDNANPTAIPQRGGSILPKGAFLWAFAAGGARAHRNSKLSPMALLISLHSMDFFVNGYVDTRERGFCGCFPAVGRLYSRLLPRFCLIPLSDYLTFTANFLFEI